MDYSHNRRTIFHQGYINSEFAVSFDELLCSVKRIDKPEPVPTPPDFEWDLFSFFGKNGNIRVAVPQPISDYAVRTLVCERERRVVVFAFHLESCVIDFQDSLTGLPGNAGKKIKVQHETILLADSVTALPLRTGFG